MNNTLYRLDTEWFVDFKFDTVEKIKINSTIFK